MAKKKTLDEAPKDEFIHQRDTNKSMDIIKQELKEEAIKQQEEEREEKKEKKEEEQPIKTPIPEKQSEPKKKEEGMGSNQVAKEDLEKATAELKKEIDEIKGQNLTQKQQDEAIEEAKTRWTKEGRNPKDYDEIVEEAEERAFKRAQKFFEEQQSKKDEEVKRAKEEEDLQVKTQEEQRQQLINETQKRIDEELKELREGGFMPEIKDEKDPNDEGLVMQKNLFTKATEYNNERIKNGMTPEGSIAKIFFMQFNKKATNEVAGADAPISMARPAAVKKDSEKPYVYARDHNKSFSQILREEKEKYEG